MMRKTPCPDAEMTVLSELPDWSHILQEELDEWNGQSIFGHLH